MPKNTNKKQVKKKKKKKTGQILIWQQIQQIPKLKNITILIKFKIRISQPIAKILLKQRSLNQIRHKFNISFFYQKH